MESSGRTMGGRRALTLGLSPPWSFPVGWRGSGHVSLLEAVVSTQFSFQILLAAEAFFLLYKHPRGPGACTDPGRFPLSEQTFVNRLCINLPLIFHLECASHSCQG